MKPKVTVKPYPTSGVVKSKGLFEAMEEELSRALKKTEQHGTLVRQVAEHVATIREIQIK